MPISETGIWIDDASGEVVFEQPRGRSTQIVAKGSEINKTARAHLERIGFAGELPGDEPDQADEPVSEPVAEPVTTTPKKATRASKKRK